jgi:3-dehydroquinate synthase
MRSLEIRTSAGDCRIVLDGALEDAEGLRPPGRPGAVITDTTVRRLYGHRFPDLPVIEIEPGEASKDLRTVERLHRQFLDLELDRTSFVTGIGGGVVCDLTGFAASTYMRGIGFGFVPTTLLAQADAAIGGKNGVNVGRVKNVAGVFRQPEHILIDVSLLGTLPAAERLCGLAEIVKHALIAGEDLFIFLEREAAALLSLDRDVVTRVLEDSVRIKAGFVQADALEAGDRRKLNFGHTLGHADLGRSRQAVRRRRGAHNRISRTDGSSRRAARRARRAHRSHEEGQEKTAGRSPLRPTVGDRTGGDRPDGDGRTGRIRR